MINKMTSENIQSFDIKQKVKELQFFIEQYEEVDSQNTSNDKEQNDYKNSMKIKFKKMSILVEIYDNLNIILIYNINNDVALNPTSDINKKFIKLLSDISSVIDEREGDVKSHKINVSNNSYDITVGDSLLINLIRRLDQDISLMIVLYKYGKELVKIYNEIFIENCIPSNNSLFSNLKMLFVSLVKIEINYMRLIFNMIIRRNIQPLILKSITDIDNYKNIIVNLSKKNN